MESITEKYWVNASRLFSQAHLRFITLFWWLQVVSVPILVVIFYFMPSNNPFRLHATVAIGLAGIVSLFLLYKQYYLLPSLLAVYYGFGLVTFLITASHSLAIPAAAALPIIIIYSGWLFGQRQSLWLLVATVILYLAVGGYAAITGTSFHVPGPPLGHACVLVTYAIFAWLVGNLTEQSYLERTRQAEELAFHDPLTGLYNKRSLLDQLELERTALVEGDRFAALLLVDLVDFQLINNTLGHRNGDLLLQQVADTLRQAAGEDGRTARISADVFAVFLANLGSSKTEAVFSVERTTQKIYARFQNRFIVNGVIQHCVVNIGVTVFGKNAAEPIELLREADLALREAKLKMQSSARFFDPSFQVLASQRASLEESLRQALKDNQFELHYQPQIYRGEFVGAEALIRWRHPERGMVPPNEFISIAEDTGLIVLIGDWVLQAACRQIKCWENHSALSHITIAVNVSSAQIAQPDFVERVLAIIYKENVHPHKLKLELTEHAFAQDADRVVEKMKALRGAGIGFSLDDFGTGYSSLSYLKRLPLDQLKIDQSFIRDLATDSDDATITRIIINLARDFGMEVIAEGVETEEQKEFLLRYGCNSFQGYLFSRPLPPPELEAYAHS